MRYTSLFLASLVLLLPTAADARPVAADNTPPLVTYTLDGIVGTNGWYRGGIGGNYIVVHWSVSDPDSPITSTSGCEPAIKIDGPNTGTTRTCSATSDGDTTTVTTKMLKIDADPPTGVTASARATDANGWYNHPVGITWSGSDPVSGVASCTSLIYGGPDTASAAPSGSCSDRAGNSSTVGFPLKFDATAPTVAAASPARAPDHDGWYNRPLKVSWSGSDATAGIASCTSLTYGGPDSDSADLSGGCIDRAGNASSPLPFALRYDQTPPRLKALTLRARNGLVVLTWQVSGAAGVRIMRAPGMSRSGASALYTGDASRFADRRVKNFVRYRYTLTALDAAGNSVARTVVGMPKPPLYSPRPGAHVRGQPRVLFAWIPGRRVRYYNLQLWRHGRKVGTWWPARSWFQLPSRWSFAGEQQRLVADDYTWYVWPGEGQRRLGKYGRLLGKSSFVAEG